MPERVFITPNELEQIRDGLDVSVQTENASHVVLNVDRFNSDDDLTTLLEREPVIVTYGAAEIEVVVASDEGEDNAAVV